MFQDSLTKAGFRPILDATLDTLRQQKQLEADNNPALQQFVLVYQARTMELRPITFHVAVERVIQAGIEALAKQNALGADLVELYYLHGYSVQAIKNNRRYDESVPTLRRRRIEAVEQLADLLFEQEMLARETWFLEVSEKLPLPDYDRLFGRNHDITALSEKLAQPDAPWLLNLTGMGGLGKSAVAHATVRRLIETHQLTHIIWIELERGALSSDLLWYTVIAEIARALPQVKHDGVAHERLVQQVRRLLKTIPYLIVVDNIEALHDVDLEFSKKLYTLVNPARFLLISRQRLAAAQPIWNYRLQPISPLAAASYIRQRAGQLGITSLSAADDTILQRIYALVSGHPQALKLFVHLCADVDIEAVLAEFESAETDDIQSLYNAIFQRILTQQDQATCHLLHTMRLAPAAGLTLELLEVYSGMSKQAYWHGIRRLHAASLLEKQQHAGQTRHYIHSLTNTFLATHALESSLLEQLTAAAHYWQALASQSVVQFEVNHPYLLRLVDVGLTFIDTWKVTADLLAAYFTQIENSSRWYAWLPLYEKAIQVAPDGELVLQMRMHSALGFLYEHHGELTRAVASHQAALEIAQSCNDIKQCGRHHVHLSYVYRRLQQLERARHHAETAHDMFVELRLPPIFAMIASSSLAHIAHLQGELEQANVLFAGVLESADETIPAAMLVRQYNDWGNTLRYLGAVEQAREKYQFVLAHAQGTIDERLALIGLCCIALDSGSLAEAKMILDDARFRYDDPTVSVQHAGFIAECHGRYQLLTGDTDTALKNFSAALALRSIEMEPFLLAETYAWIAKTHAAARDESAFFENMETALTLAKSALPRRWERLLDERFFNGSMDKLKEQRQLAVTAPENGLIWADRTV